MTRKAQKKAEKKPAVEYLPPLAILEMAEVFGIGADKYAAWDWVNCDITVIDRCASTIRHALLRMSGEIYDKESGKPHTAHMMAQSAMGNELDRRSNASST